MNKTINYEIRVDNEPVGTFKSLGQARKEVRLLTVSSGSTVEIVKNVSISKIVNVYVPQTTTVLVANDLEPEVSEDNSSEEV